MTKLEPVVEQFYRNIVRWCLIDKAVSAATVWAFIWGTAVLVLRATLDISPFILVLGLIGFPVTLVLAARSAVRRLPDRTNIRALLDNAGNCGGLLMASAERATNLWADALPALKPPRLTWKSRRPIAILATSIVYLLLGLVLPTDPSALAGNSQLDVQRETDRLEDQVRVLQEEKILDSERANSLKEKLNQARADSTGKEPAKTLEALDHLNDAIKQTAQKASESSAREASQIGKIGTAAEALQQATTELDPKSAAELLAELAAMSQKAAEQNEKFKQSLDPKLAEELSKGRLSPEQLSKLSEAARQSKEALEHTAQKLFDHKLIDAEQLKACKGDGKSSSKELADFLKKNGGNAALGDALDAMAAKGRMSSDESGKGQPAQGDSPSTTSTTGDMPGRGGVNEGPGAAAIQFGEKSSENGARFREQALPPADLAALKESQLTGVSMASPQRDPIGAAPVTGSLTGATAGGGSANTGQVLPQHKGAVERYFDRSPK